MYPIISRLPDDICRLSKRVVIVGDDCDVHYLLLANH